MIHVHAPAALVLCLQHHFIGAVRHGGMNFYRLGMPGLHVPGYAAVQKLRDGRRVRTAVYRHVYHSVRPALYLGNDGVRLGVQRALVAHGLALPGKGLRVLFQHTVVDLVYLDRASVVVCGRKQAAAPQVQVRAGQPPVGCNAPGPARQLLAVSPQNTARPFSVLVQRASQLGGVTPAEEPDEIARLSHIFEDLVEQQTSLTAAMESHSQLEESQYLLYLLGVLGGRDFSETVVQKYSTLLSRWSRFGLRVLVFRFDDTIHFVETYLPKQQWSIKSALRQEFAAMCGAQDGFGAAVDLQNGQGIAAVAAFGPDADCACILDAIREALCRSCGLSLSCGISSAVYAAGDLPHAFREASANCRYRLFHANSTITPEFVADIRNQRTRLSYTGADDILQAVKACSYPDISRGVGRFFADITRAATLPSYKLAYFDMLSRLNKLIPECAENKQTMLVNMLDLLYENCYESTEVLQQDLYKFCILLADTLYEQRSAQLSGGLLGTIYDYVEENYASPALSLSSIAESLRFSPSYLTRYFKEKTGISLMQYIDRKRFEESKRLLAATALPVKAIVERVGYTDEANFSRKFKKYEGVTPTQYRAMQK